MNHSADGKLLLTFKALGEDQYSYNNPFQASVNNSNVKSIFEWLSREPPFHFCPFHASRKYKQCDFLLLFVFQGYMQVKSIETLKVFVFLLGYFSEMFIEFAV